jgi:hypothetical protein
MQHLAISVVQGIGAIVSGCFEPTRESPAQISGPVRDGFNLKL